MTSFTPLIDTLVDELGMMPALVYGVVWRYCQMGAGVCYATLDTIAQKAGVSYRTALRHVKALCAAGYLEDTTPDLRNRPHIYRNTGKAIVREVVEAAMPQSQSDGQSAMTESQSTMTESQTHYDRESEYPVTESEYYDTESHEETIKILSKRQSRDDTGNPASGAVFRAWENMQGTPLSPMTAERIAGAVDDWGEDRLLYAIGEADKHEARTWAYVQGVLKGGCRGMGKPRAAPPPPVKVLEGGAVMMPTMGGSNERRR